MIYGGNWYDKGGALRLPSQRGAGMIVAPAAQFADLIMEPEIVPPINGDLGLAFRVRNPGMLLDEYQGYYVGLRAYDNQVVVGRCDYTWIPLQFAPLQLTPGEPYQVRIEANGPDIRVWIGKDAPDDGAAPIRFCKCATTVISRAPSPRAVTAPTTAKIKRASHG